ncbi:MAG: hypothetical protein HC942_23100 [Microcoleus sp. SU_5_6]|nr:hypothetical protein [Microcoleus sp. SU_5_6]
MAILLSLPQGWQPNVKHLSTQMREGTSAIQRAVTRLKEFGYLVCRIVRDAQGKFVRSEWDINEIPLAHPIEWMQTETRLCSIGRANPLKICDKKPKTEGESQSLKPLLLRYLIHICKTRIWTAKT